MKKLEEMSPSEIIEIAGVNLKVEEFKVVFQNNYKVIEKLRRIVRRRSRDVSFTKDDMSNAISDLFEEFSEDVDKEALVIITLYNYKEAIELAGKNIDPSKKKSLTRNIADLMRLANKLDRRIVYLEQDDSIETIRRVKVIDSQELINCIKNNREVASLNQPTEEQFRRYVEVNRRIGGISSIAGLLRFNDLRDLISVDAEIGDNMVAQISHNSFMKLQFAHPERNIKEEAEKDPDKIDLDIAQGHHQEEAIAETLDINCKYIDIDKLLLVIGYRIVEDLENDTAVINDPDGTNLVKKDSNYSMKLFKSIIANLIFLMDDKAQIEIDADLTGEKDLYSRVDLELAYMRIGENRYYKASEVKKMRERILSNESGLKDMPKEMTAMVPFTTEEFEQIVLSSTDNLCFIITEGSRDKDTIYSFIEKVDMVKDEVLVALKDKNMLDEVKFMSFFEQGKISYTQVVEFEIYSGLEENYINSRIKDIYLKMKSEEENGEKEEYSKSLVLFNNYASLYRQIFVNGKTEEEINANGFNLVATFEDDLSDEALQDLYQNGLITMDTAVDWGANLTEMLADSQVKPIDVKRLYKVGTIVIEQIRDILINGNLSNDEKEDLIYSTFDGDSEEEARIREELIQLLQLKDGYREHGVGKRAVVKKEEGNSRKEFVTDPQARWNFISLLDEAYSRKFLPEGKQVLDGHRLFLLPAKDEVFIEKMREMKKGKMVSAYGSATYIMKVKEFFENIDSIIVDESINRSFLRELVEEDRVLKIIHSRNWHKKVMEHYGIFEDNERYEEIRLAGEKVANSRKERE